MLTPKPKVTRALLFRGIDVLKSVSPVAALDKLHAKHVLPGFTDRSLEEQEIEAATTDITKVLFSLSARPSCLFPSAAIQALPVSLATHSARPLLSPVTKPTS